MLCILNWIQLKVLIWYYRRKCYRKH